MKMKARDSRLHCFPYQQSKRRIVMKRTAILLGIGLLIAGSAFATQENMAPSSKKQPARPKATVDCSRVDDATIAANVKEKLAGTPSLKEFTLSATAKDGSVTLTGQVKKPTSKGLATSQSKRVPCVKSVDNQITVEGRPAAGKKKS
jgi:osmotically-inducible protein OsmY